MKSKNAVTVSQMVFPAISCDLCDSSNPKLNTNEQTKTMYNTSVQVPHKTQIDKKIDNIETD